MTYQSDPNTNRRSDRRDDIRYTRWIVGGVVVLAIGIAAFVFTSTGSNPDRPAPAPSPSTLVRSARIWPRCAFLINARPVTIERRNFPRLQAPIGGEAPWCRQSDKRHAPQK